MVGSPQGLVLSPLLFIIQTSNMAEAIKRASSSTYADNTFIYTEQQKLEMVYKVLEAAADEVLLYMKANKLAANPEKTKFMMIGIKKRHRKSE
jgi:predicted molibdopterin-dependent oxidoreductase YjgC